MTTVTSAVRTAKRRKGNARARERGIGVLLGGGLIVVLVLAWQALVSFGIANSFLTSSPVLILQYLWEAILSGALPASLGVTGVQFLISFAIIMVIGIPVGLVMGRYRTVEYALDPYVWLMYSAPMVALYPLIVLVVGIGQPAVIVVAVLLSVVPVIINTSQGVRNVDEALIRVAASFGAKEPTILRKVILPASIPTIMAGVRLGLGRVLVGVVVGGFFAGNSGIGYDVTYAAGRLDTTGVIASVVVIVVVGVVLNAVARWIERRADSWRGEAP